MTSRRRTRSLFLDRVSMIAEAETEFAEAEAEFAEAEYD
jgi:hypothetical protein